MNKNAIKTYAIWARNELIDRVSQKAFEYGITKENIKPLKGDTVSGIVLSSLQKAQREELVKQILSKGFDQVMEETAYTWFNRFIALRFMEVNNYLPQKTRVFTDEENKFNPQILNEALDLEIDGIDKNEIYKYKETSDNEGLYKYLLISICNDMSNYLPGMFKTIDDYMTLLFPNNLLREESVLGRLISDIDEDSWADQVQIIGWLYQYYNTEPKDKVYARKSGTKIKKEEIPAVTQLFTPDWIVRYMTENSLGRLWLDGHEDKGIKSNWKYYLDEAEQEPDVQKELDKIKTEHAKLTPESISFLDPCMGSGHILVYAFDVFMQIYVSEGWTEREAAISILENNLFGLDIDERAYQLSYFALMMKARQYNRRILSENITPNVMAIEESNTIRRDLLNRFGDLKPLATRLVETFIDAKEYGSILNVEFTKDELNSLDLKLKELDTLSSYEDLLTQADIAELIEQFTPLLKQARILASKYDCVVTNPPYQSLESCSVNLREYIEINYHAAKKDLFAPFVVKEDCFSKKFGYYAAVVPESLMNIQSNENLRKNISTNNSLLIMADFGLGAFDKGFETCSYIIQKKHVNLKSIFIDFRKSLVKQDEFKTAPKYPINIQKSLANIPGLPFSYWISEKMTKVINESKSIGLYAESGGRNKTHNDEVYLRNIWEVVRKDKWVKYLKGGENRRWYGNEYFLVDWSEQARYFYKAHSGLLKEVYLIEEGVTWSFITKIANYRIKQSNVAFSSVSPSMFSKKISPIYLLSLLNSKVGQRFSEIMSPNLGSNIGEILKIPFIESHNKQIDVITKQCILLSKIDWDSFETSWDFVRHPLVRGLNTIKESYDAWGKECSDRFSQLKSNEEELNRIFIDIYGLQDELTPEVEDKDVTVRKADLTREIKSLISYAVGCMFGRYSLDTEGLAYAGGEWDSSKYKTYIPDTDNILPITDDEYFEDDIVSRFISFIKVTYGEDTLEENLKFISDALGGKGSPREVIRNYFLNDFFKDHCNTYQVTGSGKRPIYWQFDSGKKNGFKALIYMHRYTPDLLAKMRTDYFHEQQERYRTQIDNLNRDIVHQSGSEKIKSEKLLTKLKDQLSEISVFEEKLHHLADQMIEIDLDDGFKQNYPKFESVVTKVK